MGQTMTKSEIMDQHFYDFCIWCATTPSDDGSRATVELLWWLDHNTPTELNFWEWVVRYKTKDGVNK